MSLQMCNIVLTLKTPNHIINQILLPVHSDSSRTAAGKKMLQNNLIGKKSSVFHAKPIYSHVKQSDREALDYFFPICALVAQYTWGEKKSYNYVLLSGKNGSASIAIEFPFSIVSNTK